MDWPKEIAVMAAIKSKIAAADRLGLWPYCLPRVAAHSQQIAAVERRLGLQLDRNYADFLLHADGWPAFYQSVDLFGTQELLGAERMMSAMSMVEQIEPAVLADSRVRAGELLPVAATKQDIDLFVMTVRSAETIGQVIWFAGQEVQRFDSFCEFFLAMTDYNRRELAAMSTYSGA